MKMHWWLAAAAATLAVFAGGEIRAQDDQRTSPDVSADFAQDSGRREREHQERMRAFEQLAPQEQGPVLDEARERLQGYEQRSDALEERYDDNTLRISDTQARFHDRLGPLRELFGLLQLVAGDARTEFRTSLTSIEYPDRGGFLDELAARMDTQSELPALGDLERLWFELQREATALGHVRRLSNFRVVSAGGEERFEDIVRIGTFNLVADGRYLRYNPDTRAVSELQRQPGRHYTAGTSELVRAGTGDGFVPVAVDFARGTTLVQLAQTPDLVQYIQQGRVPGAVILALGTLGLLLALERLITLTLAGRKVKAQLERDEPSEDNPLGRLLVVARENRHTDAQTLELKLGEVILREAPPLQRGISFLKIISVLAPLLGLLGTVFGMIVTFQAITLFGTGDPSIMADGISTALVTTVLGLTVAVPMVLLHAVVSGRSRRIIQILQEQTAGLVADQAAKTPGRHAP